ncbi:MAG: Hpt domain-containing protein, partial [Planctomycetota bacterium]
DSLVEKPIDFDLLLATVSSLTKQEENETCEVVRSVVVHSCDKTGNESDEKLLDGSARSEETRESDEDALETMMAKLSGDYLRELEQSWDDFEDAIRNEDLEKLRTLVHTAKGSSGTFGFAEIESSMREIEDAIHSNQTECLPALLTRAQNSINDAGTSG